MAKTMDKADVKLEYDDITRIDWDAVKGVVGKAVPQLAKSVTDDLCKKLKAKELKSPYAKVGLIGNDLYLRFKDGSKHLEDVLLAKAWTPPVGAAPVRDGNYQRVLTAFIDSRKELLEAVTAGERLIKANYSQLEGVRDRLEKMAKDAEVEAKSGSPNESYVVEGGKWVAAAQRLMTASQQRFEEQVHAPFDEHRTVTKPDEIDPLDVSDWGKSFYLQSVSPKYQKAKEYLHLSETCFDQIVAAKESIDRWTTNADEQLNNYTATATNIVRAMNKEFEAARAVWAMSPIDNFAYGLSKDLESIERNAEANEWDLAQRTIDNSSGKAKKAADSYKQCAKHLAKLLDTARGYEAIPKGMRKNPQISVLGDEIEALVRQSKQYDKECQAFLKEGLNIFARIKKVQAPR